jgi:hypothetical protein
MSTTQIAVLKSGAQYPMISRTGGWTTLQGPTGSLKVRNGDVTKLVPVSPAAPTVASMIKSVTFTPDTKPAAADKPAREKMPIDQRRNGIVPATYLQHYVKTKKADGSTCLDNNDNVAAHLRGLELNEIYELVADKLNCSERDLMTRYSHLNLGQQRMSLGNLLRGFYTRLALQSKA